MRALLRGERVGTLAQVLLAVTLLAVSVVSAVVAGFAVSAAMAAGDDASTARAGAAADRTALNNVSRVLREQCQLTRDYRDRLRDVERTDVGLQRTLIRAEVHNRVADPHVRALRLHGYRTKLSSDLRFLALPPLASTACSAYQQIAYRRSAFAALLRSTP